MSRLLLLVIALLLAPACVAADDDIGDIEEVYILGGREAFVGAQRVADQQWPHAEVTDPCQCNHQGCVDGWVDDNLGCNVCITLVCDGHPAGHACGTACANPH